MVTRPGEVIDRASLTGGQKKKPVREVASWYSSSCGGSRVSIIVQDANEEALQSSGVLPPESQTRTLALSDTTICKAPGSNDLATYDPSLRHVSGLPLVPQAGQLRSSSARRRRSIDGDPRGPFAAGDVPNGREVLPAHPHRR